MESIFRVLLNVGVGAVAALSLVAGSSRVIRAQQATSGLSLVYVENDRDDGLNGVIAFSNDGSGNLTEVYGSPFFTGGEGLNGSTASAAEFNGDHQVLINPEGTLLFAVNGHSNSVMEFSINSDGTLSDALAGPFSSAGQEPAALAWKDDGLPGNDSVLVVVNKASDPLQLDGVANYSTFAVNSSGTVTYKKSFDVPSASPAEAVMFPHGDGLFGVNYLTNQVASYQIHQNGGLTQINASTPPGASPQVQGAAVHPSKAALYVGLPNQNQIAVYTFDAAGNLAYSTEVANPGIGVGWLVVNAAGTRLYTAEQGSGSITVYGISAAGKPVQLGHYTIKDSGELSQPTNMAFDPTGQFLYVLDRSNSGWLHTLQVAPDGGLSEPHPAVSLYEGVGEPLYTIPLGLATVIK